MCYEFEYWTQRQRTEEARKEQLKKAEERSKQKPAEPALPETGVKQPDPVPA